MSIAGEQLVDLQLVPTHDAAIVASLLKAAGFSHARRQQPSYLRWLCSHPDTPAELLFTLAQFPELRSELGHRAEPWELLEMLAEACDQEEAILTLGKAYYTSDRYPLAEFQEFLRRHGSQPWLLETLCRAVPASAQKEQSLRQAASLAADHDRLLKLLEARRSCEQARTITDAAELTRLHQLQQPAVWLTLAQNDACPVPILTQLAAVRDIPRAADIRRSAQDTLARRK